jgi:hypothetical protein
MSYPLKHHFIPAFFLAQWTEADEKLIEYTIKHGKLIAKPVGPHATGYEPQLYSFPELPPEAAQFLEQVFFDYADRVASDALKNRDPPDRSLSPQRDCRRFRAQQCWSNHQTSKQVAAIFLTVSLPKRMKGEVPASQFLRPPQGDSCDEFLELGEPFRCSLDRADGYTPPSNQT